MQKGYKHSKSTREKMRLSALKRDNGPRILSLPKNKDHWNWKKNPTKLAFHKRLHRKLGKASQFKCVDCGKRALDWSNEKGKYTQNEKDYKPRCRSCHCIKDKIYKNFNLI